MTVTAGGAAAAGGWAGVTPPPPRTVTELYYPGLQAPHQAMTAATPGAGSSWTSRLPPCRASACRPEAACSSCRPPSQGDAVDDLVLAVSEATTNAILDGSYNLQLVKVAVGVQGGWIQATICERAAPHPHRSPDEPSRAATRRHGNRPADGLAPPSGPLRGPAVRRRIGCATSPAHMIKSGWSIRVRRRGQTPEVT
jgi:hypothetical protein